MWETIDGDGDLPGWMVKGRTVLIPKDGCRGGPGDFRPITLLNTVYKSMTGALATLLQHPVKHAGLLPQEQKELRRGQRGCLDAL